MNNSAKLNDGNMFARIKFIQNINEIPMKFSILKRCPTTLFDWYIRTFNPYKIEEMVIGDQKGVLVKLPITEEQAKADIYKAIYLAEKTLYDLIELNVLIVLPPPFFCTQFPKNIIRIAEGKNIIVAFFIMQAIEKLLNSLQKQLKNTEIAIIDGDFGTTMSLIDSIYPYVNYLSIISEYAESNLFLEKAASIFKETGLNVGTFVRNKAILKNADIIINTRDSDEFTSLYKKDAIYFELAKNNLESSELNLRNDILKIDNLRIKVNNNSAYYDMNLSFFEAILFIKYKEFRSLLNYGYDKSIFNMVRSAVYSYNPSIVAMYWQNNIVKF